MLFRAVDIDLAAYPMLAWRWFIELPIKSPLDERTREGRRSPDAALSSVHHRSRREACDGGDLGQSAKPGTINTSAAFRTLSPMPATIGSAAGSTRGSISSASMPRSGRMPHPRTWSMSPCSAIATTAHRQHQLLRLCSARTAVRFWRPDALGARPGVWRLKEAAVALLEDRILSSRLPLSLGVMTEVEDSLRSQPSEPWPAAGASPF